MMKVFTDWFSNTDWTGMLVLFGIAFVYWQMRRFEKQPGSTFRMWGFLVDKNGFADKYAFGYFAVLGVSLWAMWYLTINDNLTEWFMTIIVSAFVLGAAWKTGVAAWREKNQGLQLGGSVEEISSHRIIKTPQPLVPDPEGVDKIVPSEDITGVTVKREG